MIPTRPYLIRAIREWAMDNGFTPQILVDATVDGVIVPDAYVTDGRIVLNIHDRAVQRPRFDNDQLSFAARFQGREIGLEIPIDAVTAVYARENGQGIVFQEQGPDPDGAEPPNRERRASASPRLKLVK